MNPSPKPFVKWAGGKGQLLEQIRKTYPVALGESITKYAEPFVGGGAVLFDILSHRKLKEVYISDINAELINTYQVIRDDVSTLIKHIEEMQTTFPAQHESESRSIYYNNMREKFNSLKSETKNSYSIEKAALFIFLNKTCFNGLYRVNKKGFFNVPQGNYKNPKISDPQNLKAVSKALQNVQMVCGDYRKSFDFIDEKTFVYIDPPYRPLTQTANFTSYTEQLFDDNSQIQLALFVQSITEKGAKVVISNSDPKNVTPEDDFFDVLYKEHRINRVQATRMINSNAANRGQISELLIRNY